MGARSILHISDVHFGPPHEPGAAYALLRLAREREPSFLVISGDLTQRARPRQFSQAKQLIDELQLPCLCVPGNHDVPMYRFWERLFAPYSAYRRHFSSELEPSYHDDDLAMVGINTAHNLTRKHGRIRAGSLAHLRSALDEASPDCARIVVAHHALLRTPDFPGERAARGAERAVRVFADQRVDLVLSGHVHRFFAVRAADQFPGLPRDFGIVHSGTTTSNRGRAPERRENSCSWIEIDQREIRVESLYRRAGQRSFAVENQLVWSRSGQRSPAG